jgi:KUP system potassium uptake protein
MIPSVDRRGTAQAALALGALGVVFGDIGTSPLYTIQTVFNPGDPHPVAASKESVLGVVSLIFWSVTLIVTVTYVLLVMRADNDGETPSNATTRASAISRPPCTQFCAA